MSEERITIDQYGLDEIVLNGVDIHFERMNADYMWIGIYRHGLASQDRIAVSLIVQDGVLRGSIDENDLAVPETPKEKL